MLRCPNISLALLYVSLPNNIRRMLLYANFNFLIAVKALLYHIVEKHTLEHKDLNISQLKKNKLQNGYLLYNALYLHSYFRFAWYFIFNIKLLV